MSMIWLFFGIGVLVGGIFGVFLMCLCFVSGRHPAARNSWRKKNDKPRKRDNRTKMRVPTGKPASAFEFIRKA